MVKVGFFKIIYENKKYKFKSQNRALGITFHVVNTWDINLKYNLTKSMLS